MKLEFLDFLFESEEATTRGQHIPHPEDAIFTSSAEALRYVKALKESVGKNDVASIKWDGGIALFFGYTPGGEFFISDKYMYPAGFYAKSPADWQRYDTQVKSSKQPRPDLYPKIEAIWEGLQQYSSANPAVYKGDLMAFGSDMEPKNGSYVFRPTTVTYTVPGNSEIGKNMAGKVALVVVHTMNNNPLTENPVAHIPGNVAVISANAGNKLALKANPDPMNKLDAVITKYGPSADSFLGGLNKTLRGKVQTYFNKKITGQINQDIGTWIATQPMSRIQAEKFPAYLKENEREYECLRLIWNAIYQFKLQLTQQLDSGISGFSQNVGGNAGGEGFVLNTGAGLIKLVNRGAGGFGAAHFSR